MRSSVLTVTVATLLMVGTAFAQGKSRTGYANLLQRGSEVKKAYDYVVVGAGTAGLTVADRLTADGKRESLQSSMRELSDFP
jgi:NADPH-dependent 2,4-dienoyl-CoA reductase/sulfur reductase-like enzyme